MNAKAPPLLHRNIWVASLTSFFIVGALFTWYPLLPLYLRQLGANQFQVGFSYSLLYLAFTLFGVVGGLLSDRHGRVPLLAIPVLASFPLYLLAARAQNWPLLLASLFLIESSYALQSPPLTSLVAESELRRGRAFSIYQLFTVLGVTVGPAMGSLLVERVGFPALIYASALISLPCGLARLTLLQETLLQKPSREHFFSSREVVGGAFPWLFLISVPLMLLLSLTVYGPFIALHAQDAVGLREAEVNLLFAASGLSGAALSLAGGRLIERLGSRQALMMSAPLLAGSLLPWLTTHSLMGGVPFFLVYGVATQWLFISYQGWLAEATTPLSRGSVIGLVGTLSGLIATGGPTMGAWLKGQWGASAPFVTALILAIITALLLGWARGKFDKITNSSYS